MIASSTDTRVKQSRGAEAAAAFLRDRFGSAPPKVFVLIWKLDGKRSHFLPVGQLAEAERHLAPLCHPGSGDVYAGVSLSPKDYGPRNRCPADEAAGIAGLWLDIDIKGPAHKKSNLPETVEEARELALSFHVAPTEIVHSGHGLQAWWLFRSLWLFRADAERKQAQDLARRFVSAFQEKAKALGWELDSTGDLARVLRVPGTFNCKAEPVRVEVLESGGERYTPGDFFALLPHEKPAPAPRASNGITAAERARKYVAKMPPAVSGQRGHDATWAVAQVLVQGFGLSPAEAWPILLDYNGRCQPPWSEKELRHKLESADQKSRLPHGYLLDRERQQPGSNGRHGENGDHRETKKGQDGQPAAWEVIRDYFSETYRPDFRDGDCLYSRTQRRLVRRQEACAALPPDLIDRLKRARNAPTFKGGGVTEDALPGFFRKWAGTGWTALLQSLLEEVEAELGGDAPAAEEFRQLFRQAFLSEFALARTIRTRAHPKALAEKEVRIEQRSMIGWCVLFAKPGPWRSIRSKLCWCKVELTESGEEVLRVAFRHELLSQLRADPRLTRMPPKRFARLAVRYGVARPGGPDDRAHGRHVLIVDAGEIADLKDSCPPEEICASGESANGGGVVAQTDGEKNERNNLLQLWIQKLVYLRPRARAMNRFTCAR